MAIDTFVSVTLGKQAAGALHPGHDTKHASNATTGDVVIAYDKTKVGTLSALREAVSAALFQVQGGKTLTE